MTSAPEPRTLQADLRFCIDLPDDYHTWSSEDQRGLRRSFAEQVAHHPDENDDDPGNKKGTRACDVERPDREPVNTDEESTTDSAGSSAGANADTNTANHAWIEGELIAENGYPSHEELIAFVRSRLDAYNSALRTSTGRTPIDIATEGDGLNVSSTLKPSDAVHTDDPTGPSGPGGPTQPEDPTDPRGVRYVLVCGRIKCIDTVQLVERPAGGASAALAFAVETSFEGKPRRLPIVAEVTFGRAHEH